MLTLQTIKHLAMVAAIVVMASCNNRPFNNPVDTECTTCEPAATIDTPRDGDTVSQSMILVSGRKTPMLQDTIWVFVWPELAPGKGWPQSVDPSGLQPTFVEGTLWYISCGLGGPAQHYDIVVYSASPSATVALQKIYSEWVILNYYPGLGLEELPNGLYERARVRIFKDR